MEMSIWRLYMNIDENSLYAISDCKSGLPENQNRIWLILRNDEGVITSLVGR